MGALVMLSLFNLGLLAMIGLLLVSVREERLRIKRDYQDVIRQLKVRLLSQGGRRE